MANAIRFSKRDLQILMQALSAYDADMEDNEIDENGNHSNQMYQYHFENYGDVDTTLEVVRQKVYWKLRRLEKSA